MATTDLAGVSAALSLVYRNALQSSINRVAVLPYLLPVVQGEGKSLNGTAEFTGAADAEATVEGVALSAADADDEDEVPYNLPWAQYSKVSSVTDLAQAATASNFNPASMTGGGSDLLLSKVFRQTTRIALGVARDIYAGDESAAPAQLAGADRAISSSLAFGGIDPVARPEWAAVESTSALAAVDFGAVEAFFMSVYDAGGEYPEFATCGSTVFSALKGLFPAKESFVAREFEVARGGGDNGELPRIIKLTAGMRMIEIDQVPIVLDKHAPDMAFYAWNTQYIRIHQLPFDPVRSVLADKSNGILALFRRLSGNRLMQLPRKSIEGMLARSPGLQPFIKILGTAGLSSEAAIGLFAQVEYMRRNTFGKHSFT